MPSKPTQANRIGELTTPLGQDKLLLSSFHAIEELSKPFEIHVECLSEDENIDFNPAIGVNSRIRLNTVGKNKRYFSGVLVEASWYGERDGLFAYQLVLRPWLWLLTQTSDCRIFQNKTVIEIIKEVFDKAGFSDYEIKTTDSYPNIEYCVQYRETHFDFVSRLMEKFGIFYFFKHTPDKHVLVLADSKSSLEKNPNVPTCRFVPMGDRTRDNEEYVTTWNSSRLFRTGKVAINAFDFAKPTASLLTDQTSPGGYAHDSMEVYDYPEKYKKGQESDLGQKFAKARLQSVQAQDRRRYSSGDAPCLFPGSLTTLTKHPMGAENREYLIVAAIHTFQAESYGAGSAGAEGDSYSGQYTFQVSDRPFRALMVTPRPIVHGPQTAIVVGPKGEEIYTDKYGRIKVKFHWDRESKGDEKSSRWVRVSQIWSGPKWGGIVIPRIGMEVVIEFIEGDPDRPLVVGTVYNGDNNAPYELPGNKTQAGVKSRSSKGGGEANYNEFVFEDKKGQEFVRFHAEKDLDSTIEDGEKRLIKGKNKAEKGETTRETTLERGDDVLKVAGDNNVTIGRHQKVDINDNQTITVGKVIKIEAGTKIELIVGGSKITMTGAQIKIESAKLSTDAPLTELNAATLLKQTAGIIKLN